MAINVKECFIFKLFKKFFLKIIVTCRGKGFIYYTIFQLTYFKGFWTILFSMAVGLLDKLGNLIVEFKSNNLTLKNILFVQHFFFNQSLKSPFYFIRCFVWANTNGVSSWACTCDAWIIYNNYFITK